MAYKVFRRVAHQHLSKRGTNTWQLLAPRVLGRSPGAGTLPGCWDAHWMSSSQRVGTDTRFQSPFIGGRKQILSFLNHIIPIYYEWLQSDS